MRNRVKNSLLLPFAVAFTVIVLAHQDTRADGSLVTDISTHLITVESDFTGTDLLLFGTIRTDAAFDSKEHGDIIVVVRGAQRDIKVRKKERVAGIWANTQSVELRKVCGPIA